jgi:hypothetical protein
MAPAPYRPARPASGLASNGSFPSPLLYKRRRQSAPSPNPKPKSFPSSTPPCRNRRSLLSPIAHSPRRIVCAVVDPDSGDLEPLVIGVLPSLSASPFNLLPLPFSPLDLSDYVSLLSPFVPPPPLAVLADLVTSSLATCHRLLL